jgi:hypothetical protein
MHASRQTIALVLLAAAMAICLGCDQDRGLPNQAAAAAKSDARGPQTQAATVPPGSSKAPPGAPVSRVASPAAAAPQRPSGLPSTGSKDVTFDDIKLELKKEDAYTPAALTDKVKQLDGESIRIRGFILPSFQQEGIKQFVLVRDNMECCFGPGALLHDCILVEMIAPATATFTVRPVSVEGKFSIREVKDPYNGRHLAIYHLDGKQVR